MITVDQLHQKLKHIKVGSHTCLYTKEKCEKILPIINEINTLKQQKNALILAHSYVSPDIVYGVADFVGDSYELSRKAKESSSDTIIFSAVKFMAETAKMLCPDKTVIIPSLVNGCSLADSITGDDVKTLKKAHLDYTFVCYINTTADVKAECDVCVTSSNVYDIIEAIPNKNIYFLPDKLMAKNAIEEMKKRGVQKHIKYTEGTCYVHEEYDPDMIRYIKKQHQEVQVVSHPECSPDVLALSDYIGSTSQMMNYVKTSEKTSFFLLTECGLVSRLQTETPNKRFIGTCTMCKYMKSNTLEDIKRALTDPLNETIITIDQTTIKKALACVDTMFAYVDKITS